MSKSILMTGAVLMALAVILGAFGAHALKSRLATDMMQVYHTGVQYQFYHALGILIIGVLYLHYPSGTLSWSAILMTIGIALFSGSLYLLAVTGIKWLGAITPLGGTSFIVAWILFFIAVWKKTM
ncbi:DUF423 domain-containing protein [Prolixibacter denitrificans]|uniref:DUF423 domain-containing protein n=1 Tax=Prolixibacter denitrificans TaxID=1541063 RepID=A0A2P8C7N1_9BACT|nr:DUF423 domain-containing protein [Prolixibacter denitrificans]PSK80969.1 uncharacterized membrane protein YgdD (TMEM256/DUF423 family) [Prolixibacter denitrificans]GET22369.1 DUF423 domain-containing protein [Prolixibacter denitrificans]